MEHLLKSSDEYEVKLIFEPCTKFARDQSITKENVMKLLGIAELYGLDDVRQGCDNLLKNMGLKTLSETVHLEDLDLAKTRYFLEQRIERLEEFLDALYPQFIGLVSCTLWLMKEGNKSVQWCKHHVQGLFTPFRWGCEPETFSTCMLCGKMLHSVVYCSISYTTEEVRKYNYGGQYHFDESLPSIIEEFYKLKKAD